MHFEIPVLVRLVRWSEAKAMLKLPKDGTEAPKHARALVI
jgi:hypothetical protein